MPDSRAARKTAAGGAAEAATANFLSYARADADFALRFAADLTAAGLAIWVDQHEIRPAAHWDREVEAALRAADAVIVILSPHSAASENVADEVSLALDAGKRVIPILMAPTSPPLRMARLQFIDATRDYDAAVRLCVSVVRGEGEAQAAAAPTAPALPPDALARIVAALTPHLGPIARLMVEREAKTASSPAALVETLAAAIPDDAGRAAFRRAATL